MKRKPSSIRIKRAFSYDQETGLLIWNRRDDGPPWWNSKFAGKIAGTWHPSGYRQIKIDHVLCLSHQVIWCWMTGAWPDHQIDHCNGIRDDNRWLNLRAATPSEQCQNIAPRKDNKSGCQGVYYCKHARKWRAVISKEGKRICLGNYSFKADAVKALLSGKKIYHPFQPIPRGFRGGISA